MIPELADTMCITQILAPDTGFSPMTYAECTAAKNNGEIDVQYCYSGNDYFTGAVKACGGVSKMPTKEQLGQLATYLYNYDGTIGAQQFVSGLTLDTEKASQFLSAKGTGYDSFFVWSGQEYNRANAYYRLFTSHYTDWYRNDRYLSNGLAVCLGD